MVTTKPMLTNYLTRCFIILQKIRQLIQYTRVLGQMTNVVVHLISIIQQSKVIFLHKHMQRRLSLHRDSICHEAQETCSTLESLVWWRWQSLDCLAIGGRGFWVAQCARWR